MGDVSEKLRQWGEAVASFLSQLPDISSEIKAVLITFAVTIFWNQYAEHRKDNRERHRIAGMLLSEVLSQAAFLVIVGSAVNYAQQRKLLNGPP